MRIHDSARGTQEDQDMEISPPPLHAGGIIPSILRAILQLVLATSDPSATCELMHHDASGTYYLYCTQTMPDGTELISVGHFISDTHLEGK